MLQHQIHVGAGRHGVASRRDFLRSIGVAAGAGLSMQDRLCLAGDDLRRRGKACILLWMAGGPSQFETFDPKPGHANGGGAKTISTSAPGVLLSDNLPSIAKQMGEIAVVRSMTSKEGSHPRAAFLMHHGYLPMGGVEFPTLGSNVAHQIGDAACQLPSYVRIGGQSQVAGDGGLLGVDFDPLVLPRGSKPPQNSRPCSTQGRFERRIELLRGLETDFAHVEAPDVVENHFSLVEAAKEMILSPSMEAFDISREPQPMRDAYGEGEFASGCLLARRLIEAGVTFVEVTLAGWDTHQNNAQEVAKNCAQIDRPIAALIADLKSRGMLDDTLIVWMGEFGRTPKINPRGGRDHYPKAFCAALAGGGVRGGQVIGSTDPSGSEVIERPVTVSDLFRTIYTALGIDPEHENQSPVGRPIKLVDGGSVVSELLL